jgi:hypothetical protein
MGPGSGTFLEHIRKVHPKKAPELVPLKAKPLIRDFFSKAKMKIPFNEDIAVGKLLKWIVKTDQPFTIVDNEHFQDFINYLKNDINLVSRRTIMRRLEDVYLQKIQEVKSKLNTLSSKFSVTCDVWTSKNQLSFFGFTIHYIDDEWKLQENLLTFKFLEGEHDGESLSVAFIDVLEQFGIADRLLGVTGDNATNNSTMIARMEQYYHDRYPEAGFSVAWNRIECMAHVLNLGAQQILKQFKQPLDKDTYEAGSDSSDDINFSDDIYIGIDSAIEKLNHYYDKISPMVGIALLLNPCLKKQMLTESLQWEEQWVESVLDHFMSSFDHYKRKLSRPSENFFTHIITTPVVQVENGVLSKYKNKKRKVITDTSTEEEYTKYFNEPLSADGTNVLSYWKAKAFDYPILSAMAKDYLTVQASSVPAERAFSSGVDLVTANRCSLSGRTIEMTQFLKFVL